MIVARFTEKIFLFLCMLCKAAEQFLAVNIKFCTKWKFSELTFNQEKLVSHVLDQFLGKLLQLIA